MQWTISGSYYEACNCQAVCPCRRQNGAPGGRSTYGLCQFLLSWIIGDGHADDTPLGGLSVAMAGFYSNDEPGEPWSIKLYIDERASDAQYAGLEQIFLGRAGGNLNFTTWLAEVFEVRRARVTLDHGADHKRISVSGGGSSETLRPADFAGTVTCGIPGHDHPGTEYVTNLEMADGPLQWRHSEVCGFATDFAYHN